MSGDNESVYAFAASVDGDRLTFISCMSMNHIPNGNHGATYEQEVKEIIGLV